MPRRLKRKILDIVTSHYLSSSEFNGLSYLNLLSAVEEKDSSVLRSLSLLIKEEKASLVFGDVHPNPHIRALPDHPIKRQLEKLKTDELLGACVYPLSNYLATIVPESLHADKPFTRMLALGEPQLQFKSFDLSVLEYYRNDPRYLYENNDISGHIYISTSHYESDQTAESDKILLRTFGFSYDEDLNRAVAVFLRYLADLSPEHQQIWKAKLLKGNFKLHPDYYRNSILGDWGERVSLFDAFLEEIQVINKMAVAMRRPNLFRNDFADQKPKEFSFLVRPTLQAFNEFILTLDKMISDNINKAFFQNEVPDETEQERGDGKIVVQQRGTLAMLEDWIRKYFKTDTWEDIDEAIKALKSVRKLRQSPAHAINENVFDQKYFQEQRKLMMDAYSAIRLLRLLLANHPKVRASGIEVSDCVKEGLIWTY